MDAQREPALQRCRHVLHALYGGAGGRKLQRLWRLHHACMVGSGTGRLSVRPRERAVPALRRAGSDAAQPARLSRSEEHTSELQSLMRISYAVFCLKNKRTLYAVLTVTTHKYLTTLP